MCANGTKQGKFTFLSTKKVLKSKDNFMVQWVTCWCLTPIVLDQESNPDHRREVPACYPLHYRVI